MAAVSVAIIAAGLAVLPGIDWQADGPRLPSADVALKGLPTGDVLAPAPLASDLVIPRRRLENDRVGASAGPRLPAGDIAIAPPPERFDGPPPVIEPAPQLMQAAAPVSTAGSEVWAVVLGIDDYPGRSADLRYATEDAWDVNTALHEFGVPDQNRLFLLNRQVSASVIRGAMRWLVERAGPDDTAVIFYAGHVRKLSSHTEAMLGADGVVVPDYEIAELLAPLQARRAWIALAACYGGGFTEVLAPGRILTAAADADSLAYENSGFERSYLVQYMVHEGWLMGQAGGTVEAAFQYAEQTLEREYPQRVPVQIDMADGDISLEQGGDASSGSSGGGGSGGGGGGGDAGCKRTLLLFCRSDD